MAKLENPPCHALFWLYNGATEADEIVDILYDNLGKKCKGAKSMSDKAYCIYKNLDSLDIDSAVPDLVWNHIEDKAWGAFFGLGKHAPFGAQLPGGTQPQVQLSRRKEP